MNRRWIAAVLGLCASLPLQAGEPPHRHVAVTGQGEVSALPDRARLRLGVTRVDAELARAETDVNRIVRGYVAEARKLGIKEEHLNTTGVSLYPEYVWDEPTRNNRLVGYRVNREIEVQVHALERLGDLVLRATEVGVNQVHPPVLESSKAREIQQQALVKAALDAQARARLLAETLGMKLGAVHQLNAAETAPAPPMPKLMAMRAEMADSGNAEMGMSTGELRYGATVSAEFELLP